MAGRSILPFNEITINGVVYGSSGTGANANVFIFGSGTLSSNKIERTNTTDDGTVHVDVVAADYAANCELYGDYTALNTSAADQDKIEIGGQTLYGTVTADYSAETDTTSISCTGKHSGTPEPLDNQVILDGSSAESAP